MSLRINTWVTIIHDNCTASGFEPASLHCGSFLSWLIIHYYYYCYFFLPFLCLIGSFTKDGETVQSAEAGNPRVTWWWAQRKRKMWSSQENRYQPWNLVALLQCFQTNITFYYFICTRVPKIVSGIQELSNIEFNCWIPDLCQDDHLP